MNSIKSIANAPIELAASPIDALEQNLLEHLKRKHPRTPIPVLRDAVRTTLELANSRVIDLFE